MAVTLHEHKIEGFTALTATNGALALTLLPELGGKIASLRDMRTGREWLWRHPRMAYARVPHGSVYTKVADTGGWDECFPSVSACAYPSAPWKDTPVQDHGELWSQPSDLHVQETEHGLELRTRWKGVLLPYTFERTLVLDAQAARFRCAYTATNTSKHPMPFIWSAHPLIAIEPGMRLELPETARFHGQRPGQPTPERGLHFPLEISAGGRVFNLATLPEHNAGASIKIWSEPLPAGQGWAALHAEDGALHMRWDTALLPQVACWFNLGAWGFDGGAPYYNLGLEPCMGAQDSLADAVERYRCFATLAPEGTQEWWLDVELTA